MNDLNIKSLLLTKQLKKGEMYDFDYDNQIIEHEKNDAKRTYKHTTGYFPGVATINDKIVYIENRDGNANVIISQEETLYFQIYLCGRKMDQAKSSMEAEALYRAALRKTRCIVINYITT